MDGLQRYTVSQMRETISYLLPIFDVVRLVDPRAPPCSRWRRTAP